MRRLVVVGNAVIDHSVISTALPQDVAEVLGRSASREEKKKAIEKIKALEGSVSQLGGSALNSARVVKRETVENDVEVAFVGCVGDDSDGNLLLSQCTLEGIVTEFVQFSSQSTGMCGIVIDAETKERSIWGSRGASADLDPEKAMTNLKREGWISQNSFAFATAYNLTTQPRWEFVAALAKHAGVFFFALSKAELVKNVKSKIEQLLPLTKVLFCDKNELLSFAGQDFHEALHGVAAKLAAPGLIFVTDGPRSTFVASQGGKYSEFPLPHVLPEDQIVSTNGAGDVFTGSILAALISTKTFPFGEIDESLFRSVVLKAHSSALVSLTRLGI